MMAGRNWKMHRRMTNRKILAQTQIHLKDIYYFHFQNHSVSKWSPTFSPSSLFHNFGQIPIIVGRFGTSFFAILFYSPSCIIYPQFLPKFAQLLARMMIRVRRMECIDFGNRQNNAQTSRMTWTRMPVALPKSPMAPSFVVPKGTRPRLIPNWQPKRDENSSPAISPNWCFVCWPFCYFCSFFAPSSVVVLVSALFSIGGRPIPIGAILPPPSSTQPPNRQQFVALLHSIVPIPIIIGLLKHSPVPPINSIVQHHQNCHFFLPQSPKNMMRLHRIIWQLPRQFPHRPRNPQ